VAGSFHNQVLALAGIFQSACLVQQLAREGHTDSAALRTSIQIKSVQGRDMKRFA
jgi:CII-binding regulator of phage lambda lysogenization HflD